MINNLTNASLKGYIISSEIKDLGVSYSEALKWCSDNNIPFLEPMGLDEVLKNDDRELQKKHVNSEFARDLVTYKPFSKKKEQLIQKVILDGRTAQNLLSNDNENHELLKIVEEGKRAEDRLILSLGHYYIKLATSFIGKGVEYDDLLMSAIDGAQRALSKFDLTRGLRFSTYATWWIIQAMQNEIATFKQGKSLPTSRYQAYKKVIACKYQFEKDYGRTPTNEELAEKYNLTLGQIKIAEDIYNSNSISLDSLVTVEKKEDQIPLSEMLQSSGESEMLVNHMKKDAIDKVLIAMEKCLNKNEKFLVTHKYLCNILNEKPLSDEELAKELDVTQARIYQIDKASVQKLSKNRPLKEAVEDWYKITNNM